MRAGPLLRRLYATGGGSLGREVKYRGGLARTTKVESCDFPDDRLYEAEGLVWVREEGPGVVALGVTAVYAALAGPLTAVRANPIGAEYDRGRSIGTLEGPRYFGPIRTPIRGALLAVNEVVLERPRSLSEDPYGEGWFARLRPGGWSEDRIALATPAGAAEELAAQIRALRVRCFAAFPDHELIEIGTECAAVLVKLNDLLDRIPPGDVIHLVSDDWTAPIEMERWSEERGQAVLENRREGNLYHFLVRKAA